MKKYLIIYHEEDNDGVFSAAIIHNYLMSLSQTNKEESTIDLLPATYSKLSEEVKEDHLVDFIERYDQVWMTDISFNEIEVMEELSKVFGQNFIWIDHHKAIIDKVKEKNLVITGYQDPTFSAIHNAYKYIYKMSFNCMPKTLQILTSYDSFNFTHYTNEYATDINQGANERFDLNIEDVCSLLNSLYDSATGIPSKSFDDYLVENLEEIGATITKHQRRSWRNQILQNAELDWTVGPDNNPAAMIMLSGPTTSKMFDCLKERGIRNGIVLKRNNKGHWIISLYNINLDDDFHCGKYLQAEYNGGGHAGAAGATIDFEKFTKMIMTKHV